MLMNLKDTLLQGQIQEYMATGSKTKKKTSKQLNNKCKLYTYLKVLKTLEVLFLCVNFLRPLELYRNVFLIFLEFPSVARILIWNWSVNYSPTYM